MKKSIGAHSFGKKYTRMCGTVHIFLSERFFTLKTRRNFIFMTCIITKNISCLRYVNTRKSYWFGALASILPLLFLFTGFSLW